MSFATILGGQEKEKAGWFGEESQAAEAKPQELDGVCPHCRQPIADETHLPDMLRGGFRLFLVASQIIILALLRFVRFAVAMVLCLLGQLGVLFRTLGMSVVHPADRKLLSTLLFQATGRRNDHG